MRGKTGKIDRRRVILNYIIRKEKVLPPVFENVAICIACGKEKHVNAYGFCEKCWITHAHIGKK